MSNFSFRFNYSYRLGPFEYGFLILILFLSFYFGISSYAFENMYEGLYAEIPREMLQLSNYVIPKLNYVPYIETPPLFYWLVALSYKLFGISEWSARVIPATFGSLVCISLVTFGNLIRRSREGWFSAIMLATSVGFVAIGRVLVLDMVLTFFVTASLLTFYYWYQKQQNIYLHCFYVFMALAFLTKGLLILALIPAIVIAFISTMPMPARRLRQFLNPVSLIIFTAIVAPWHYLAIKQHAGFIWDYMAHDPLFHFVNPNIADYYHTGPIYFYLPKIIIYLFPWSLLAVFLWQPVKNVDVSLHRFMWLWFVIALICLSLSRAKSDYAMILAAPPLAFLLALKVSDVLSSPRRAVLIYFFIFLGIVESVALGLLYAATTNKHWLLSLPEIFKLDSQLGSTLGYMTLCVSAITVLGLGLCLSFRRNPLVHFIAIVSLILPIQFFYLIDKQKIEYRHSEAALAQYITAHNISTPIYLYQDYERLSSLLFYLKKRLPMIDSHSQHLHYGKEYSQAGKEWFLPLNYFLENAADEAHYIVLRKDRFAGFIQSTAPINYEVVAQSGSSVLLSRKKESSPNSTK